jgi:prephenate dehydrogenase
MKVAIIGSGLIGGSVGLALKKRTSATVTAFDRDPGIATRAVERGAADEAAASIREAVRQAEIIFVATPVGAIVESTLEAGAAAPEGAVLTDVGSTKSRVVIEVERSLPPGRSFIGGHPMAGSEDEGIDAARPDLFEGNWWILSPTEAVEAATYQRLHSLLATLGARVLALKPEQHDELLAVISHVPQLTATALMNMAAEKGRDHAGLLALTAGGFRDVTRVAASNPEIWIDICRENRDAIAATLEQFAGRLLRFRDLVLHDDSADLREAFLAARSARRALPGKSVEGDLFEVRVPVPDRPGLLAEITTAVGDLGINIEDLQITHSAEGGRGTLHLSVVGEAQAHEVVARLAERSLDAKVIEI